METGKKAGLGKVGQRAAPPGFGHMHYHGKQKAPLSDSRPWQKINQIRLSGLFRMPGRKTENKGDKTHLHQRQANQKRRLFLKKIFFVRVR